MALCPSCRTDCCSCTGCREMTTSSGIKCCSKCYTGVERSSQAIVQSTQNVSMQQSLIQSIEQLLKNRNSG
jgi:hypothetical protein